VLGEDLLHQSLVHLPLPLLLTGAGSLIS